MTKTPVPTSASVPASTPAVEKCDIVIIGAGAAGLFCAIEAGKRGRKTTLIDKSQKTAEKIRISGGGRCNFTNIYAAPENYLSQNPHFCKSALKQYTQHDFIALVEKHGIAYHEKTLGQLFCDHSAKEIINMLIAECDENGVNRQMGVSVTQVEKTTDGYTVTTDHGRVYKTTSLVIATGGLSIPKIGATDFGYKMARQFDLPLIPTRAGLVPLTFTDDILDFCKALSGVSVDAVVSFEKTQFREGLLFTHRGISGPSILQISSYWKEGRSLTLNLLPDQDMFDILKTAKQTDPKKDVVNVVSEYLPKRLSQSLCDRQGVGGSLAEIADKKLKSLSDNINRWQVKPNGTEGYRTAEVTLGGVDTDALSSKTFEVKSHAGLFFIGEVLDVTGHLGGFNFQWAWSSGYVAGQYV